MTTFWAKTLVLEAYRKKVITSEQAQYFIKFISSNEQLETFLQLDVVENNKVVSKKIKQLEIATSYEIALQFYYKKEMDILNERYPRETIQNKLRFIGAYIRNTTCLNDCKIVKLSDITGIDLSYLNILFKSEKERKAFDDPNFMVKERTQIARYLVGNPKYEDLLNLMTASIDSYQELLNEDNLIEE